MSKKLITPAMIRDLRERTGVGIGKCKAALEKAGGDVDEAIANLRKEGVVQAVKKKGRETKEGLIKAFSTKQGIALVEVNAETDFVVKNEHFQKFVEKIVKEVSQKPPASVEEFLKQKLMNGQQTIEEERIELVQKIGENIQIKRTEFFPKKKNASLSIYSHLGGKLLTLVEIEGSDQCEDVAKDIAMHVAAESPEYIEPSEVPQRVLEHEKEIVKAQIQNKPPQIQEKIIEGKLNSYFDQVCLLRQKYVKDSSKSIQEHLQEEGKNRSVDLKLKQFLRWKVGS